MNSLIESLNDWGGRFVDVAFPIFWQSSLLIALIFALGWLLRRKIRPAVRYAFWLVVVVKLSLPPSLALPTAPISWLRVHKPGSPPAHTQIMTVTSGPAMPIDISLPANLPPLPPPKLSVATWAMLGSAFVSVLLGAWSGLRWRKINRCVRDTTAPPEMIAEMLAETRRKVSVRKNVAVQLTTEAMSPAVCGLWRPIILLPQSLIEKLSPEQIRAVLLHELVHVRRWDAWINCVQMLLQIVYWWHPLVWFANARIRRVREEAVDDAVMFALNDEAEIYAPTLLEVAKLAFHRPLAGLGIIGILESRTALRHRIERLLNFKTPGRAGLSAVWILALTAFAATAVPMGEPIEKTASAESPAGAPSRTRFVGVVGTNGPQVITMDSDGNVTSSNPVPVPNPGTNVVYTNPARQNIFKKLKNITFDQISFTNIPLSGVVRILSDQILQRDADHEGVVLLIDKEGPKPNAQEIDLGQVTIDLRPGLKNVRLMDVLEAITKCADRPIKYSIRDYGIAFSFRGPESPELHTRTFKIDLNAFYQKLDQLEHHSTNVQEMALNFFKNAGISLTPPKSVFFNPRQGTITVRATTNDLDRAEQALEIFYDPSGTVTNETAPQIQNAKLLFQRGKLDEAWAILQKVLSADPDNQAALYYSALIEKAQARKMVDDANRHQMGAHQLPNQTLPATNVSVIRRSGKNANDLLVRTFKLDRNTVGLNLGPLKSHEDIQPALSNLFQKAGVDLGPPKILFFNDRAGTLTVRATASDLDMLEEIISTLNITPPEVTIKARFVEIDAGKFGADAFVKEILGEQHNGSTNISPWTGILTRPQFAKVLQALEKGKGADLLDEGQVTTLSGRQAQFQIVNVKTFVNGVTATVTNNQTSYNYKLDSEPFGSTLDVVPAVSDDTNSITMRVTPTITEFLGYENPKDLAKYDQKLKGAQLPLPKSRIRQTTTVATVCDGQTLVIGNLSDEWVLKRPDGTELRQPYTDKKKKQLLIFITATIIDPSGNRIHPRLL